MRSSTARVETMEPEFCVGRWLDDASWAAPVVEHVRHVHHHRASLCERVLVSSRGTARARIRVRAERQSAIGGTPTGARYTSLDVETGSNPGLAYAIAAALDQGVLSEKDEIGGPARDGRRQDRQRIGSSTRRRRSGRTTRNVAASRHRATPLQNAAADLPSHPHAWLTGQTIEQSLHTFR